jgi:hypothetical protein
VFYYTELLHILASGEEETCPFQVRKFLVYQKLLDLFSRLQVKE